MKATESELNNLHGSVCRLLTTHVSDPDCPPIFTGLAIKFLKDNEITASIADDTDANSLSEALKQKREKRKLRVVE